MSWSGPLFAMVRLAATVLLFAIMSGSLSAPVRGETPMSTQADLTITIVYENSLYEPGLTAGWGFAALIEYQGHTLLFDTGADGEALVANMAALNIDPLAIESVVLSHIHHDHTGGLDALLATPARPEVIVLPSFPEAFKRQLARSATVIEAAPDQIVTDGIFTTGEMNGSTPEQAIAIEIEQGMVIVTGCAHPGIVAVIERVKETSDKPIHLVLGGFHLKDKTRAEIASIIQAFRRLGVERVGPCHCTGEQAITAFAEAYGDDFVSIGTGTILEFQSSADSAAG